MSYCEHCGRELPDDASFCTYCGAPVRKISTNGQSKRKQTYAGKIVKCPNCGEILDAFVTVCPSCGCRIRGAESSSAVQDFGIRLSQARSDKEKINIIRNFPIPNTVEDVLEFVILASTNINENQNLDDEVSDAWFAKLQQAYQKASISFKDQPEYARVEESYNQVKKARSRQKRLHVISTIFHFRVVQIILVILIIVILIRACSAFSHRSSSSSSSNEVYAWPTSGSSQYLPEPPSSYGKIWDDDATKFKINVDKVTEDQYQEYVEECKEQGFTLETVGTDSSFKAYNEDHYYLDVLYLSSSERMDISLTAPMKMSEIRWPDSDVASQIPKPSSMSGNVESEKSGQFIVYIDDISSEEFINYTDKCMDKGFTVDYYRDETNFHAYNDEGYYLQVKEQAFDIMYINIKEPEEEE